MRIFKYCLLLLPLIFLLTGCSFDGASIQDSAVANHTDISINYLDMVFGNVGNVLHGLSGQMLGHLFYKFNQGVLCLAGLWLAYTVFTLLMSSVEGQFQQKKPHIILLKVALGIALIIPNPTTGYSAIQDILMKVVVEGVSLANMVWSNALTYIQAGNTIWHQPRIGAHNDKTGKFDFTHLFTSLIAGISGWPATPNSCVVGPSTSGTCDGSTKDWNNAVKGTSIGTKIFLDDVCTFSSAMGNTPYLPFSPHFGTHSNQPAFLFPNVSNDPNNSSCGRIMLNKLKNGYTACEINKWEKGGEKNGMDMSKSITNGIINNNVARCLYLKQSVQIMANDLMPAAKRYACSINSNPPICQSYANSGDLNANVGQSILSALLDYANTIQPAANLNLNKTPTAPFLGTAKSQGWASAGRYYWDLSRLQNNSNDAHGSDISSLKPIGTYLPDKDAITPLPSIYEMQLTSTDKGDTTLYSMINAAQTALNQYSNTSKKGQTGLADSMEQSTMNTFMNVAGRVLFIPLFGAIMDILQLFLSFSIASGADPNGLGQDPILWLSGIGFTMMGLAVNLYLQAAGVTFGLAIITSWCNAMANEIQVLKIGLAWVTPLFWCAVGSLFVSGMSFGYYLPLYPYLIYTFGVIGWLIAVIEAMVAAPLVAFGLTHPENHDFLGQAQQALMLGLSIFLRPTLMVIGLLAGMITSYVSLRIVLFSFDNFLGDLYSNTPNYGFDLSSPMSAANAAAGNVFNQFGRLGGLAPEILSITTVPVFLIVFANIVYQIINKSFNLIFLLPEHILRWIGAPSNPALVDAGEMAKGIESSVDKAGGKMQDAMSHGTQNAQDAVSKKTPEPSGGNKGQEVSTKGGSNAPAAAAPVAGG